MNVLKLSSRRRRLVCMRSLGAMQMHSLNPVKIKTVNTVCVTCYYGIITGLL